MKQRTISILLAFFLLAGLWTAGAVFADDEVDEAALNAAKDQLNSVNSEINGLKEQVNNGKAKINELSGRIKTLEGEMAAAERTIASLQRQINDTKGKVAQAEQDLAAAQARIDDQNENMSLRIRSMYKSGDMGIIGIVLGSESITDLMTNMDMAQRIMDNDVELLRQLEEQHKTLEAYKAQLEEMQAKLIREQQAEQEQMASIRSNRSNLNELKAQATADNKVLERMIDDLNAEANSLTAEILRLQGTEEYVGGVLAWPAPGVTRVTSEFGYRYHPILHYNKLHTGMDIGAPSGTTIVAANAGTVIKAGWNNSYGYMVMIDHGGGIVTLYAHNSELLVSTGDIVTRGQSISKSGSTGMSTGPHLHFEVRVNGEYVNPRDYL